MSLLLTASDVTELSDGVWEFEMPPQQIRQFGTPQATVGTRSILLLDGAEFERQSKRLMFPIDGIQPLNLGSTSATIGVRSESAPTQVSSNSTLPAFLGRGDREFLALAKSELSAQMSQTAEDLLHAIRAKFSGDLKRGLSRNFSETPDNFWYVIVQPRIDELSITVRGSVAHFRGKSALVIKDDRGNTRFKVTGRADIPEALKLISHALRKRVR